ncbi:uncharacterized protein LOC134828720 [Culicoides brevitarsis]|uniref:uncharacterized protein LOC134828720 n=1 Tax=Culicoides brevitarsis TaxID=469753 RepID=UPI00307C3143
MDGHEIDCLNDINSKYATLEVQLDQTLSKIKEKEENFIKKYEKAITGRASKNNDGAMDECLTLQEARKRNLEILKNLDMFKARFRSRALYSPVQTQLDKLKILYKEKMEQESSSASSSIPTSIKKTYGPTFV